MGNLTFEQAVAELEKITEQLESGNAELEKSLELFERGVTLTKLCTKMLDDAQQKIGILTETPDGKMTAKAFVSEDGQNEEF